MFVYMHNFGWQEQVHSVSYTLLLNVYNHHGGGGGNFVQKVTLCLLYQHFYILSLHLSFCFTYFFKEKLFLMCPSWCPTSNSILFDQISVCFSCILFKQWDSTLLPSLREWDVSLPFVGLCFYYPNAFCKNSPKCCGLHYCFFCWENQGHYMH